MSIRERQNSKNNAVSYQVCITYKDANTGTMKTHSKSGFSTYEEAKYYENLMNLELKNKKTVHAITIDELFYQWLKVDGIHYQDNTIIDYKTRYKKYIKPNLGNQFIHQINYQHLQSFFNSMNDIGYHTNKKVKDILNVIYNYALKCGYISINPIKQVSITHIKNSRGVNLFNSDNYEFILNFLEMKPTFIKQSYRIALIIGRYTGLRISEVFALEKDDIHFNEEFIRVNKKLVYSQIKKKDLYISYELKSKKSNSQLPLHNNLKKELMKWFEINKHNKIICDKNGNYLNPKQLEYFLWKFSSENGFKFHFHDLRHAFASQLVASNVNIKVAQELLRHANIQTTLNIYSHVYDDQKKEALYQAFPEK